MKRLLSLTPVLLFSIFIKEMPVIGFTQPENEDLDTVLPLRQNKAFVRGEKLEYRVHYGWIDAGEAILEVKKENRVIMNRNTYHMVGTGRSVGAFNWFYKVQDKYETYMDEEALLPWKFIRRVSEGGYIINQDQHYNHYENTVNCNGKIMKTPKGIQDMLSSFYFARNMNYANAKPGDEFELNIFLDDEIFPLKIRFAGRETIENDLGTFRCLKFNPVVQEGRVFNPEKDLTVWLSDDKNHIPITIEAKLFVGSAKMDLTGYSGLANPIAMVK